MKRRTILSVPRVVSSLLPLFLLLLSSVAIAAEDEGSSFENYCKAQFGSLDTCRKELAFRRDDPSYCRSIETTALRNSCYTYFAKNRKDSSFCTPVRRERNSFSPIYKCLEPFIKSTANITICDSFLRDEETQDTCYEKIYNIEEDPALCSKLHDPKKKIKCLQGAARSTFDVRYCDAIKEEIDIRVCKELEIEKCDTAAHLDTLIDACKYEAVLQQRRNKCNAYNNEIEVEFAEKESGEYIFKHDDPLTESFNAVLKAVDLSLGVATVEVTAKKHTIPFNVRIGNVVTNDFVNMYVVNIWKEEGKAEKEGQPPPITKKAELCFFRTPKPEVEQEKKRSKKEETPKINATENRTEQPPTETAPEEQEEETGEAGEEIEEPEASEPEQEGFLRRAIRWFWGLFGVGR